MSETIREQGLKLLGEKMGSQAIEQMKAQGKIDVNLHKQILHDANKKQKYAKYALKYIAQHMDELDGVKRGGKRRKSRRKSKRKRRRRKTKRKGKKKRRRTRRRK